MPNTVADSSDFSDEWSEIGALWDLLVPPAWHKDAACREHPEVEFFPGLGTSSGPAKALCSGCLSQSECRAWAMTEPETLQGIWGGLSQRDRRRLGARRPQVADPRRGRAVEMRAAGMKLEAIAVAFGVHKSTIHYWTTPAA